MREIGFVDPASFGKRDTVSKVELSIAEREHAAEWLMEAMASRTDRMNAEMAGRIPGFGERGLLTPEGRIDMRSFAVGNGGPYDPERIASHEEAVERYDVTHSGALSEGVRKLHDGDTGSVVREYRRKKRFHDGDLGEAAAFCVMNRFLKGRFLVVRTAEYDDYEHLVDFLVVDLENGGKPICAIDEIVGGAENGARSEKKKERLKSGMRVRYGVESKKDGDLVLGEYDRLPGVYAAIGRKELKALFDSGADLSSDDGEPTPAERGFFIEIVGSMRAYVAEAGIPDGSPVHEFLRVADERLRRGTDAS